jgi:hypothetical protein
MGLLQEPAAASLPASRRVRAAHSTSSFETAFRVAGIEKRTSTFDFIAFTAENRCRLFRKMLWLDWN